MGRFNKDLALSLLFVLLAGTTVSGQVDGGWSSWSAWSECSASCGIGQKTRLRSCTNPAPSGGGKECGGQYNQVESCYGKVGSCDSVQDCVCTASGDPHVHTCDGQVIHYQGPCKYTYAKNCRDVTGLEKFHVKAQHDIRFGRSEVSWVNSAEVTVYGHTITIGQQRKVHVDGVQRTIPIVLTPRTFGQAAEITVKLLANQEVQLSTDFGLKVTFDGNHRLRMEIPKKYQSNLCGICGNYNKNKKDDLTLKNGTSVSDMAEKHVAHALVGDSWLVLTPGKTAEECQAPRTKIPSCSGALRTAIFTNEYCGATSNPSGPFQECMNSVKFSEYFENCKYDVCALEHNLPEAKKAACGSLEEFAKKCKEAGYPGKGWRTVTKCPLKCGANMEYTDKAKPSECQNSCVDPKAEKKCGEKVPLSEGCKCLAGYVRSGDGCVLKTQCGCYVKTVNSGSFYYKLGETWLNDACTLQYTCKTPSSDPTAQTHKCSAHARCTVEQGTRKCICNQGYTGNGITCSSPQVPVDGSWSSWSEYGKCTKTCGNGARTRTRKCNNPAPSNGGLDCSGNSVETTKCFEKACPVNGGWSLWSDWGKCSGSCGLGQQSRTRKCSNPTPANGGKSCEGSPSEVKVCTNSVKCPVDGVWSAWTQWSECSGTCGEGNRKRTRTCTNPSPSNGGKECQGYPSESEPCVNAREKCPIDGKWSLWSTWSECSGTCGEGERRRTRTCSNPAPQFGGKQCGSTSTETEPCVNQVEHCPVNGKWSLWGTWSECSGTCGEGERRRTRTCTNPAPQFGGKQCGSASTETEPCVNPVENCPVNGKWSLWGTWSECSGTCGEGERKRTRTCTNPAPQFGGKQCGSTSTETEPCVNPVENCPVNGKWSLWGTWSECSGTCGEGERRRTRTCTNPAPKFGGKKCGSASSETEPCVNSVENCPVNGKWSLWGTWSECSGTCGEGERRRTRTCTNPAPKFGGKHCGSASTETEPCVNSVENCPVNGKWSLWGAWSDCSGTCGDGERTRKRTCTNPTPEHGGKQCQGTSSDKETCVNTIGKCPIHGQWSFWGAWSECSGTCGVGERTRTRSCTNPAPVHGGKQCQGPSSDHEKCVNSMKNCPVDGKWTNWGVWSDCSGTCGEGERTRTRTCTNPAPQFGGKQCGSTNTDTEPCVNSMENCPVNGKWSLWGAWSECSGTCGDGERTKKRTCTNPSPAHGGKQCQGPTSDKEKCVNTVEKCPIHGKWSLWGSWSECSGTCGDGKRTRSRTCTNPSPDHGGKQCEGSGLDRENCVNSVRDCPVNGKWASWGTWSECSGTCGDGERTRTRACTNPAPKHGGKYCVGLSSDKEECVNSIGKCPINGKWTPWGAWSECSGTCGNGKRTRTRTCTDPAPENGGKQCHGQSSDQEICANSIKNCPVHGKWSLWGTWSECSGTCGKGERTRTRTCTNPAPQFGGKQCGSTKTDTEPCVNTMKNCPVNGKWSLWGAWSECSGTCGDGERTRKRTCTNPSPAHGGKQCQGPTSDKEKCVNTVEKCPIHGKWSLWGSWSECSGTCGDGKRTRSRTCTNPSPDHGGKQCEGSGLDRENCVNSVRDCPVNGKWASWGTWSECSGTCGDGERTRTRACTNPAPKHGGKYCVGLRSDKEECVNSIGKCPINGKWTPWGAWSECSGTCGNGKRTRTRTCTDPAPENGGKQCHGQSSDQEICANSIKNCPVHGKWSLWGTWSECSGTCGKGERTRTRTCTNPAPQFGGKQCGSTKTDTEPCVNTMKNCPVNGKWSLWGAWSECSGTCGDGERTRKRTCTNPSPAHGGTQCQGPNSDQEKCVNTVQKCPIHGKWSLWGAWSECSGTCGDGERMRTRTCKNPSPEHGGKQCTGPKVDQEHCVNAVKDCPVDGKWTPWGAWSECSGTCGDGERTRTRRCANPAPKHGGKYCLGPSSEEQKCVNTIGKCPVQGKWSLWGAWSECSETCGEGERARTRTCTNPAPAHGGNLCQGKSSDKEKCVNIVEKCPIHGKWSIWGAWSACSGTCGEGERTRTRTCTNPAPEHGGKGCQDSSSDKEKCVNSITKCPVDGTWSLWGAWSECSGTCGDGLRTRTRTCTNPAPEHGGKQCQGSSSDQEKCVNTIGRCPIHGKWSPWGAWSECSRTCGEGEKTRSRTCSNPSPEHGGKPCQGPTSDKEKCVNTIAKCPIHGQWSLWGVWSECSGTCGDGERRRTRTCTNPAPEHGGKQCQGPNSDQEKCVNTIGKCPLHGKWSLWGAWSECSGTCGDGERTRSRTCTNPSPEHGGKQCNGPNLDREYCVNAVRDCPVDGKWTPWSAWSECSGTCGDGKRTRTRQCTSPAPKHGGMYCLGPNSDEEKCVNSIRKCPIDGKWSLWGAWSDCSGTCGEGKRTRTRTCTNPAPKYGGKQCQGPDYNQEKCLNAIGNCPIHGKWSLWGAWSECSATCGDGKRARTRTCTNPYPEHGGKQCQGPSSDHETCLNTVKKCPIDGKWSYWGAWSECSGTCGEGKRSRTRTCTNPAPRYGGKGCLGSGSNEQKCVNSIRNCPVDGSWSVWGSWSECSGTCGDGEKTRTRTCTNPAPNHGGKQCQGPASDQERCVNTIGKCPIHGKWSLWGAWSECSGTCGDGERTRIRTCTNPSPEHGGKQCQGPSSDKETCLNTVKKCPIHGKWSPWGVWSECSGTCGDGKRTRIRTCTNPSPEHGGKQCQGPSSDKETCLNTVKKCPIDGKWSPWGAWSECSGTCGEGKRMRTRTCNNPSPEHGGKECLGSGSGEQKCVNSIRNCPVDGSWSVWGSWSECSGTCGDGERRRMRTCTNPAPEHGGKQCFGPSSDQEQCVNTVGMCPIHGKWSPWGAWSECSGTCGDGERTRSRTCTNPHPEHGGKQCSGLNVDREYCVNAVRDCPVHGKWTLWGAWSECSGTCGVGERMRTRQCASPAPKYGGKYCIGPNFDEEKCVNSIGKCPIDGKWSIWGAWSDCSGTCGEGERTRTRTCTNPAPEQGGESCKGSSSDKEKCFNSLSNCPVDGAWSLWGTWSECSRTCGDGKRTRTRTCTNPAPKHGGKQCQGPVSDQEKCVNTVEKCPIHGKWSPWGTWSECSGTCGDGERTRTRTCTNPAPNHGGKQCQGPASDQEKCVNTIGKCPIHGKWSLWGAWSECSGTCGDGERTRMRTCTNPSPEHGGKQCQGQSSDKETCLNTVKKCPIDGKWSPWGVWSKCSGTCGEGKRMRKRTCTNPAPGYGGKGCLGSGSNEETCVNSIRNCPVDGSWSVWGSWSECSGTCGDGERTRTRTCANPAPNHGGKQCQGPAFDQENCVNIIGKCPIHGEWSLWGSWSECSGTCGDGERTRIRTCTNPSPEHGGKQCQGQSSDKETCLNTVKKCPIHGKWSPWGSWSECSGTCGDGERTRMRTCTNPSPEHGGKQCQGQSSDKETCLNTVKKCPINGKWSPWGAWSECSGTCGEGKRMRTRTCTNPAPEHGGKECLGSGSGEQKCVNSIRNCPVDGSWSVWGSWSECSGTCGDGDRTRLRTCTNPYPEHGGKQCSGSNVDREYCVNAVRDCPLDGKWTPWGAWSECSGTCGYGERTRTRSCTSPAPKHGGKYCLGPSFDEEKCENSLGKCPIDGQWSIWGAWTGCSGTCGEGERTRKRTCTNPSPKHGGKQCQGLSAAIEVCKNAVEKCPIDGKWTSWSQFTDCSVSCGSGTRERSRTCTNPPPQYMGSNCEGKSSEIVSCTAKVADCPIDGVWSNWGYFSKCSVTCGFGTKTRSRECSNPYPQFGGKECMGPRLAWVNCQGKIANCPVDGKWSQWSSWGDCSGTCDPGIQLRHRICAKPSPQYGGKGCFGLSTESRKCTNGIKPCPVDGAWSAWSDWTECSGDCGKGVKTRSRSCTSPNPQHGGKQCPGVGVETKTCVNDIKLCPINGDWSRWSDWSACSGTCGPGNRTRSRQCTNPAPQNNGKDCRGESMQYERCYNSIKNCPVNGGWSNWSNWSSCSATCGTGARTRRRECNDPSPMHGGAECEGPALGSEECTNSQVPKCPLEEAWSKWGAWSKCSVSCDEGIRTRARQCSNGNTCNGNTTETVTCSEKPCQPVPGWSEFSAWSKCNAPCGSTGVQARTRTCTNPPPVPGQPGCPGSSKETRTCSSNIPCNQWSAWGTWTTCSRTCGGGYRWRTRKCLSAAAGCSGPSSQNELCNTNKCFDAKAYCDYCVTQRNGVGTYEDPNDCSSFYQCQKDIDGTVFGIRRKCGVCTFWSQKSLSCVFLSNAICPRDAPAVTKQPYIGNCAAYYVCRARSGQLTCCASGTGFNFLKQSCVDNGCADTCDLTTLSPTTTTTTPGVTSKGGDTCKRAAWVYEKDEADPRRYYLVYLNKRLLPGYTCPAGTVFLIKTCLCSSETVIPTNCDLAHLPLATDFRNKGNAFSYVDSGGVKIINGAATFDGKSTIEVPFFSNYQFKQKVSVSFWYKYESTGINGLLANGDCKGNGSISIWTNGKEIGAGVVTQSELNVHRDTLEITTSVSKEGWHHVVLIYDGHTVTLYVDNARSGSRAQSGDIKVMHSPLTLGNDYCDQGFLTGKMSDLRIYKCSLSAKQVDYLYKQWKAPV